MKTCSLLFLIFLLPEYQLPEYPGPKKKEKKEKKSFLNLILLDFRVWGRQEVLTS